jgi:hypothetical protein
LKNENILRLKDEIEDYKVKIDKKEVELKENQ